MSETKKNETPKYVDPNVFADYAAGTAEVPNDPTAAIWQGRHAAEIAAATTPRALAEHVWNAAAAEALLAKVQGAYKTDPLTMTVIGAVSQHVMEPMIGRPNGCQKRCSTPGAEPCTRKIWNLALLAAFRRTKDEYVQTFLLDQLRQCGCKCRAKDVLALKANAASAHVKAYIDWTADEVAGTPLNALG